ncbi:MAG: lysophospholipase [Bacteroidales bacterium]|nr:lysophospholipase [Bacteroidales bacterium]
MNENTFVLKGKNDVEIFVRKWLPEKEEIKGVLQISHGMAEHSNRYREFGEYMTSKGYVVYANDHRGHGQTAKTVEKVGFFGPKDGWKLVVDDVQRLAEKIKEEYPELPHFLFGHSMGSFVARVLITDKSELFNGAIISGTNGKSGFIVSSGIFLAKMQGLLKGKTKSSQLLTDMSFKGYNDPFKPIKTPYDWLSRDYDRNKDYCDDPFCGTVMSNRFFVDMLSMIGFANNKSNMNKISKDLPILLFSGAMDPVGNFGKEVEQVYNIFKNLGVKDINLKLYEGGRHEMLNETNRQEVYEDVFNWLEEKRNS